MKADQDETRMLSETSDERTWNTLLSTYKYLREDLASLKEIDIDTFMHNSQDETLMLSETSHDERSWNEILSKYKSLRGDLETYKS